MRVAAPAGKSPVHRLPVSGKVYTAFWIGLVLLFDKSVAVEVALTSNKAISA
jgi:hypothetical protein